VGPEMGNDEEYCFPNDWAAIRYDFYKSQAHPEYHFDDEKIVEGLERIAVLKDQIVERARTGRYVEARKKLGAALHTMQDFYSHTNWVELGQRQPFQLPDGRLRFSTDPDPGFDQMIRIAAGRTVCGEPGDPTVDNSKDLVSAASRGGNLLTSGYFFSPTRKVGQCTHGAAFDGIKKDTFDSYHGRMKDPGEDLTYHENARLLAKEHSRQFIEDILAQLDSAHSLAFRTTLFEVRADRANHIPTAVKQGETWVFRAPRFSSGNPPQEIIWSSTDGGKGGGQPLKAPPAGVDMGRAIVPRPLTNFYPGALIGMIQSCAGCMPRYFPIGEANAVTMPVSGALSLLVNDSNLQNNSGSFWVEFTLCAKPNWNCEVKVETANPNLISNGSFEQGPPPGSYLNVAYGSRTISGWLVTVEGVDYVGTLWRASDGARSIDLDGSAASRLSPPYAIGGIQQTIATTPGMRYEVSFDLAGNGFSGPPVKRMRLLAAGQSADFEFVTKGNSPTSMGWTRKSWTFTAASELTSIEFRSLNQSPATGYGAAIDNVAVRMFDPTALK